MQPTKPTNSMLRNIAPKMPVYRTKEVIFLFSSNVHSKKEVLFMNRSGMKCVLYPRVSTEMQVDEFSLDGQINSLKRFADREEMIVVDIYEDAGKSGKSIEGRPAFKKMLSDMENGLQIDYICL